MHAEQQHVRTDDNAAAAAAAGPRLVPPANDRLLPLSTGRVRGCFRGCCVHARVFDLLYVVCMSSVDNVQWQYHECVCVCECVELLNVRPSM